MYNFRDVSSALLRDAYARGEDSFYGRAEVACFCDKDTALYLAEMVSKIQEKSRPYAALK